MKKLGLFLMTILLVCFSCVFTACKPGNTTQDELTLSKTAITLEVGATHTLTATTNVTGDVAWSTDNASIATVEGGVVTAIAAGSATITATAGSASATCTVTVTEAQEYAELTVDKTVVDLRESGASVSVNATFTVNNEVSDATFVWTSANPAIATVANGSITPVGVGSTVVTVSVEYKGETYAADVNVEVKPDEYIQVSKGTIELELSDMNGGLVSDTFTATAYKAGVENTEATLSFVSSNADVATVTVEAGVATVTSVSEGACTISVSYDSAQGKIESNVTVIVSRSRLVFDDVLEIPYVEGNTMLDVSALGLQGDLDGVYAEDEKVAEADGILNNAFVEKNKGIIIPVEVRTSIAIYEAQLLIAVPYAPAPKYEVASRELADMPTFDGDATTLGFPEGTDVAYELVIDPDNGKDGWTQRMFINAASDKDVVAFDVIIKEAPNSIATFHAWPALNTFETQGSYDIAAKSSQAYSGADADRKIFVLGENGKQPASFAVGTLYTVYFYINKAETHVQFSTFSKSIVHVANIRCMDADEVVNDPTLPPPPISQGEDRTEMPIFGGDVTALGFAEGTVVYEVVGPQSNANDVKFVAQVDASGNNMYAKLDFVLTADTGSIGLWITASNSHLGYYTVTPTGFTTDGNGDASRHIFVTDENGASVGAFEANKKYTLYVGFDGREATIQVTTWAALTMYIANFDCLTEDELTFTPPSVPEQGESISILFIGNSFSDDTEAYMVDILLNLGYTNIDVGNLYIGGCSIDTHYENIMSGANAYDFRMRSHNGSKYTEYVPITVDGKKQSLDFAIAYKDWDIISVQQASGYSGQAASYANLDALVAEVQSRATNPDVEFVFNMTWAYQANSTHAQFPDYGSDQMTMYNAIVSATQEKVSYTVVPNGTAIQNARTSFIGDNLTRDGYHLDLKIGRFIAGLTFVAKVTGADLSDFDYRPSGVTKAQFAVAIESVQNALATPFAVTASQITVDPSITPDADIQPGGSNTDAVTVYGGDVTALGFAAGTTVYEYKGVDSASDKVAIKTNSTDYDYVEVQFVIASGDGYFFLYGLKGGNWHNGGASYVIDPSWIRIADGNNSPSDRRIEVLDAEGNKVTSLMQTGVVYTLRVFTKVGELDEIRIGKNGSTIYFANVSEGLEADLPAPPVEGPIKQGDGSTFLPAYEGNVTDLGFEEGHLVQYMVTETVDNVWGGAEPNSGKTREQLAARIHGEAGKYVTIKFVTTEDIANGGVFYVWGLLGSNHTQNGAINFTTTTHGRILDVDGYPVTSISKNTVYVLELYIEGTDTYKVSNICATGMVWYLDADSITYSDDSIAVQIPDPEPQGPIVSAEANSNALTVYDGDATQYGFASDTTVYQLVAGGSSWDDRVAIAVDPANYYADIEFVVVSGNWFFNVWVVDANGMLDGSYLVAELGGGTQHATFGDGFAIHYPNSGANGGYTRIQVVDVNGNVVIGGRELGTRYVLRVYLNDENLTEIQIGQSNVEMLFGSITQGLEEDIPTPTPDPDPDPTPDPDALYIYQGIDNSNKLPDFDGDVTSIGFNADEYVQEMYTIANENPWGADANGKTRESLAARIPMDTAKAWVTVRFAVSADISSGNLFYAWGTNADGSAAAFGFITITGANADGFIVKIVDADGNAVTALSANTVYTLVMSKPATNVFKLSSMVKAEMSVYFSTSSITYYDEDPVYVPEADVMAGGANPAAVTVYDGDVTELGFAEGTTVYEYVGVDSVTDKAFIKVDSTSYDYVEVQFVIAEGPSYFFLYGLKGGNWHNGGASYVIDPSWIRIADGNNTPSDRRIEILDADGNVITSQMEVGVVYTLRVFTKVGELDEIAIAMGGSTIYLANVSQGLEADLPTPEPDPDPEPQAPIVSAEESSTALTVYDGDVTAIGFEEGTTVYQLTAGDSSWNDRVKIAVDSNYKYLDVQFVVSSGTWYFTVWVVGANGMLDGSYLVAENAGGYALHYPNTGANGGNTKIQVIDENGFVVIGGRDNGTVYTLRVWLETEGLTEVQIGTSNTTMCFANINCTDSDPERPIKQGDDRTTLEYYDGDETALGFAEGTSVQQLVGSVESGWGEAIYSERAVIVADGSQDYIAVDFILATDYAGTSLFHIWPSSGAGSLKMDGTNAVTTATVTLVDQNGVLVTAIKAGKIYTLRIYDPAATHVAIGVYGLNTVYFANIVYGEGTPDDPIVPAITAGSANPDAVTIYNGDVTALGFAEGTTVYEYVGVDSVNDKAFIKVDSTAYDYVDVQFVIASGNGYFFLYGLKGGSWHNGGTSYVVDPSNIRFSNNTPSDRRIEVLDAEGNQVTTLMETGVVYTLRVFTKVGELDEIGIAKNGSTIYLANVSQAIEEVDLTIPTPVEIKIGDEKADPTIFDGDVTMYGFAEGTEVVQVALESADASAQRLAMAVNPVHQYLAIDFSLEYSLLGNIYVWTVTDGGERVLAATILADGGIDAGALVDIVIKDSAGNDATNDVLVSLESGEAEKYTLYIYYAGADEVHIGCDDYDEEFGGNILYFANAECRTDVEE